MNEVSYVAFVLLFITVIFVVYFLQLSARIDKLSKRYDDMQEDFYRDGMRAASQFDILHDAVKALTKSVEDMNKHE